MDNSVVVTGGRGYKRIKNGKNTINIELKRTNNNEKDLLFHEKGFCII